MNDREINKVKELLKQTGLRTIERSHLEIYLASLTPPVVCATTMKIQGKKNGNGKSKIH